MATRAPASTYFVLQPKYAVLFGFGMCTAIL